MRRIETYPKATIYHCGSYGDHVVEMRDKENEVYTSISCKGLSFERSTDKNKVMIRLFDGEKDMPIAYIDIVRLIIGE